MKAIKMILPVTAILFAVVAAFATTATPNSLVKTRVSVRGGACVQQGVCEDVGASSICTYMNDGVTLLDTYAPTLPEPSCAAYSAFGTWLPS